MRNRILLPAITAAIIALSFLFAQAYSAKHVNAAGGGLCTNLYFQGGYGFAGQGFTTTANQPQPIAYEGGFIAIPNTTSGATNGTFQGTETITKPSGITRLSFTGTFQMSNRSCGGAATITTSNRTTQHYDFGLNQWSSGTSQEVNFIQTDPKAVVVLT